MGFAKVAAHKEQEKPALLEQWPDLGYLGLGAWWGWIWLCYNSIDALRLFPDELRANNVFLMYLFSTVAIAVSMLAAAAAWRKATNLVDNRIIVAAFGGMASVSTFLMGLSGVAGSSAMFAVFAVLTGVGTSMLCLRAGRVYGALPLGESLTNGALSLILAAALYYVGSGIVAEWRLAYISLLPIAAAGLFSLVGDEAYPSAGIASARAATGKERVMFRRLVVASSIVAFTAGFGKGVSAFTVPAAQFAYEGAISVFFIGLIAVVIVFAVNRYNVYQSARVVYSTLMVMGIALMLASCFGFSVTFLIIGKEVLWLVFRACSRIWHSASRCRLCACSVWGRRAISCRRPSVGLPACSWRRAMAMLRCAWAAASCWRFSWCSYWCTCFPRRASSKSRHGSCRAQ